MNPLIPFFFTALAIFADDDGSVGVRLDTNRPYYSSDTTDIVRCPGTIDVVTIELTAEDNAVRRYIMTLDTARRHVDVTDAGPAETIGSIDDIYITDKDGNTVDVVYTVADAEPVISQPPEGGLTIELTDCITASVAGKDEYVLRYTSVVKRIDEAGHIDLLSIRPTTDELDTFVGRYRIYDRRGAEDIPLDATALRRYLRNAFPLPGTVSRHPDNDG